jgi:putative effector of murein hydrolase
MEGRRRYRLLTRFALIAAIVAVAFIGYLGPNLRPYRNHFITLSVFLGVAVICVAILRGDAKNRGIWH